MLGIHMQVELYCTNIILTLCESTDKSVHFKLKVIYNVSTCFCLLYNKYGVSHSFYLSCGIFSIGMSHPIHIQQTISRLKIRFTIAEYHYVQ